MLKCPYCGSENVTGLKPVGVSKPRNLYKYEFAQHCKKCKREFNKTSRFIPYKEDPKKLLNMSTLPSSREIKEQILSYE